MASINYAAREISVKIVYYGPGLSGKTTNLQVIHKKVPPEYKSDMVSLATETDRTLFFDFLPLDLGKIKGFSTKFQLYTVPGQVYYNATRKLVLRGVDGVVFVADSGADKVQENLESFQNLEENLSEYGYQRENIPIILQYNKRDLPNALSIEELEQFVNKYKLPYGEAIASKGKGVFDSLKQIGKIVIDQLNKKYSRQSRPMTAAAPSVQQPAQQAPVQHEQPRQQQYAQPQQSYAQPDFGFQQPQQAPQQPRPFAPAPQPRQQQPAQPQRQTYQQPPMQEQPTRQPPQQQQPAPRPQPQYRPPQQQRMAAPIEDQFDLESFTQQAPPQEPQQRDAYEYGSIELESMANQMGAPSSQSAQQNQEGAAKTDLDLEIEKYQREIEDKQRRMRAAQALNQPRQGFGPAMPQQQMAPNPGAMQQQQPQQQKQFAPPVDENDYDVYNLETPSYNTPPQQTAPHQQAPSAGADEGDDMFFTSVDPDRQKKPIKRPVNPRNKPQKGFLSKLFNREAP